MFNAYDMKTKFNPAHHLFRKAIMQDSPAIEPNPAIAERLNYYYTFKQPTRKLYSNSFAGMFVWLFSLKGVGLKAGFVSACLAYFLFVGNIKNNVGLQDLSDTCQVHQMLIDTNYLAKDTCK